MWKKKDLDIDKKFYKTLKYLSRDERITCYNVLVTASSARLCGHPRNSSGVTKDKVAIKKVKKELDNYEYKMKNDVFGYNHDFEFVDFLALLDDSSLSYTEQQEELFEGLEGSDIGVWLNKKCEEAVDESKALEKDGCPWLVPWMLFVRKVYVVTLIESRAMKKNRRASDKQLEMLKKFLESTKSLLTCSFE